MRSILAKLLLLTELLAAPAFAAGEWHPGQPLECGTYAATGRLLRNNQGQVVIVTAYGSTAPAEFILLGGSASEKARSLDTSVSVEFEVRRRILPGQVPAVSFQRFVTDAIPPHLRQLAPRKCRG